MKIRIKTKDKLKKLLGFLDKLGYTWSSGHKLTNETMLNKYWSYHKQNITIYIDSYELNQKGNTKMVTYGGFIKHKKEQLTELKPFSFQTLYKLLILESLK